MNLARALIHCILCNGEATKEGCEGSEKTQQSVENLTRDQSGGPGDTFQGAKKCKMSAFVASTQYFVTDLFQPIPKFEVSRFL